MTKNTIRTFNVTYDSYDKQYIIVCPKCGEYVYWQKGHELDAQCPCGFYWKVSYIAVGKKVE